MVAYSKGNTLDPSPPEVAVASAAQASRDRRQQRAARRFARRMVATSTTPGKAPGDQEVYTSGTTTNLFHIHRQQQLLRLAPGGLLLIRAGRARGGLAQRHNPPGQGGYVTVSQYRWKVEGAELDFSPGSWNEVGCWASHRGSSNLGMVATWDLDLKRLWEPN